MNSHDAVDLAREAVFQAALLSTPVLLAVLAVGLVIGLLQTLTQIQDSSLAFVAKLVAVVATIGVALPWLMARMLEYSRQVIVQIPDML